MKKVVTAVLACILVSMLSMMVVASDSQTAIYYDDVDVTVCFESDTSLTDTQMQRIADIIAYDIPVVESRAWCWLTGHDKTTQTVTAVHHKQLTYDPRCLLKVYHVTTCANCDYYEEVLSSQSYISCCPND